MQVVQQVVLSTTSQVCVCVRVQTCLFSVQMCKVYVHMPGLACIGEVFVK